MIPILHTRKRITKVESFKEYLGTGHMSGTAVRTRDTAASKKMTLLSTWTHIPEGVQGASREQMGKVVMAGCQGGSE